MPRRHLHFAFASSLPLLSMVAIACSNTPDRGSIPDLDATPNDAAQADSGLVDTGTPLGDTGGGGFGIVTITPDNSVLKIDVQDTTTCSGVPDHVQFKAINTVNGTDTDVTSTTTFTVDDTTLGSISGATFTTANSIGCSVKGKTTQVHGLPGNAIANVTVIALRVTGANRDFFFEEPYQKDPTPPKDTLKFQTNLKDVDVAFLMDTTASMGPEIANLKTSLSDTTNGLIAQLKKAIPSVGIAIAHHEDFPVYPFGYPGATGSAPNKAYEMLQPVTTSASSAQSAVSLLQPYFGGILPEDQYEAMYQLLTGEGFTWTTTGACGSTSTNGCGVAGSIAPHTPAVGKTGGADFRAGSLPVVVEITDASWNTDTAYKSLTGGDLAPHSEDQLVDAFNNKIKAKFVGVHALIPNASTGNPDTACTDHHSSSCDSAEGLLQAIDLANKTNSILPSSAFPGGVCPTAATGGNCPLVFPVKGCDPPPPTPAPDCGSGVSNAIVNAIQAISIGTALDVTAIPRNDPANVGSDGASVDAVKSFIQSIRAMDEGDSTNGCPAHTAVDTDGDGVKDTFTGLTVGTPVCFEVNVKQNVTVPASNDPQFFDAFIDVVGMPGSITLDTRSVLFLVPPKAPGEK